ncbi:hypothetical protein G6F29_004106 [Rhizopus arrhizus]|nr:hypothetical protein G6F21_004617 [Rhizopus arrhizus]KAG0800818.1 hypothetical protein G6F22_001855 [Rhizopus arrhizus]KAG0813188.1 hypothetical protein G6F20_005758 [Rhizopus arrhizus]KAG0835119.1 hypothetical protein G6F18_005986 [Rhizopus arrhizus]KAG0857472.1 hypothetical protein G6F17_003657 [Rhizopus arrhizus]
MLRKPLQQTLLSTRLPISRRTLNPISYRPFFTSLIRRQELEAMKLTSDSLGFEPTIIKKTGRPIYLDMQATSPLDSHNSQVWPGNRRSRRKSKRAKLINADPKEIIFTSDTTESNNMSIKGVSKFYTNKKKHIITTQTSFDITYLSVQSNGLIDLNQLKETIRPDISIVSNMTINETDFMQPIDAIAGKVPLDVNTMNIDLMSISGHKLYIPKGVDALYVRRRPRVRLEAVQSGDDIVQSRLPAEVKRWIEEHVDDAINTSIDNDNSSSVALRCEAYVEDTDNYLSITKAKQSSRFVGTSTLPPRRKYHPNSKRPRSPSPGEGTSDNKRKRVQFSDTELDTFFFLSMKKKLKESIRTVVRKNNKKMNEQLAALKQKLSTTKKLPSGIITGAAKLAESTCNEPSQADLILRQMRSFMDNRVGKKNEIEWQEFVVKKFDTFKNEETNLAKSAQPESNDADRDSRQLTN